MNLAQDLRSVESIGNFSRAVSEPVDYGSRMSITVIDARSLDLECFVRCIGMCYPLLQVKGFTSIKEWQSAKSSQDTQVLLYNIGAQIVEDAEVSAALRQLVAQADGAPVIVLGDSEDFRQMISVFDCGAHGYIPSTIGLDAIVEATKLSSSGGVFLPMASIAAMRNAFVGLPKAPAPMKSSFTDRQLAVSEALRRGKSNKTIAYELNMCESTVKVHIRNIMKKLNASNRTEAAFKLNTVCFDGAP